MKKIVAAITSTLFLIGAGVTTVSAQTHEVKLGENLWELAKEYDTTVEEIMEINELETSTIQPKQLLYISKIYEVQRGDTLSLIADEHDVTVEDLKKWNELESSLIVVGQELKINSTDAKQVEKEDKNKKQSKKADNNKQQSNKEDKKATAPAKAQPKEQAEKAPAEPVAAEKEPQGKTFSVTATAYTAECNGCSGITYTGVDLNKNRNAKVIAVDPNVIPLGSKVYVEGYGHAIAADIGSAIKGNKIDLHVPTKGEAFAWGVRTVNITIVE